MLSSMGYRVLTAMSGREAVDMISRSCGGGPAERGERPPGPDDASPCPDLVILDMIMPEMGGGETFDRIRKIAPHMKVLLSSGYSINGQASEILDRGCNGFIQKPFDMQQLSQKIRDALTGTT